MGTLGVGGTLFVIAGFVIGWPAVFAFLTGTKVGRVLLAAVGAIAAGVAIYAKGTAAGKSAEDAKQAAQTKKETNAAAADSKRIDAQSDAATDADLGKWDRKGP